MATPRRQQPYDENILYDLIDAKLWDDAMAIARTKNKDWREELRRKGEYGLLPLHEACGRGAPFELVKAMVAEYPEAVKVTDMNGQLPLHHACWSDDGVDISPRVVRLLLDAYREGSTATDSEGALPLHWAAHRKAPLDVLGMLLEAHPEGTATRNKHGELPLHYLADKASPDEEEGVEKIKLLMQPLLDNEEACLVRGPQSGETALHAAAKFDVLSLHTCMRILRCPPEVIVKVAGRHPEQLRVRDESGNLPLHMAAANPNLNGAQDGFEDLISKWLRFYPEAAAASDGDGRFPLVLAIESGKKWTEGVEALVGAAGHVITVRDEVTNLYPFMLAAAGDDACLTTVYSLLRQCPELKRYVLG